MRRTTVFLLALLVLIVVAALAPAADPSEDEGLEEYVPSQQISLDSSISFPVDI